MPDTRARARAHTHTHTHTHTQTYTHTMGQIHCRERDISKVLVTGWKFKIFGYKSMGDSVPCKTKNSKMSVL